MLLHSLLDCAALGGTHCREIGARRTIPLLAKDFELIADMAVDANGDPHDVQPDQIPRDP